jgi:hypothetical protein
MNQETEYSNAEAAILDWLVVWPDAWDNIDIQTSEVMGKTVSLRDLLGKLEDDPNTMDSSWCDALQLPHGSTYGDAVAMIRRELGLS